MGSLLVTSGGHSWKLVQTCSFEDTLHWYWHLVAKAHTFGKWMVCILLECFLFISCLCWIWNCFDWNNSLQYYFTKAPIVQYRIKKRGTLTKFKLSNIFSFCWVTQKRVLIRTLFIATFLQSILLCFMIFRSNVLQLSAKLGAMSPNKLF